MVRRSELALWLVVVVCFCASVLATHGRGAGQADVRIQASDVSGRRAAIYASVWRLDVNTATRQELELLPGIGVRRAQLIVQERLKRGGFSSVWELCEVPGLGRPLVQRIEPLLQVNSPAPPPR